MSDARSAQLTSSGNCQHSHLLRACTQHWASQLVRVRICVSLAACVRGSGRQGGACRCSIGSSEPLQPEHLRVHLAVLIDRPACRLQ